jgi:hypothetical protein
MDPSVAPTNLCQSYWEFVFRKLQCMLICSGIDFAGTLEDKNKNHFSPATNENPEVFFVHLLYNH